MIQTSPNSLSSWCPILPPETAERALRVVEEIAADLRSRLASSSLATGPSLAGGTAGLALFFSYLDQVRPGEGYDDLAMELLEQAVTATAEFPLSPSLYSGFSGVAWTMEHLRGRLYEDEDGEDTGEEVATALVEHVGLTPWRGHYDVISGLVGFGVYALERLPRPGGEECLRRVVARLSETAEHDPQGVTWLTGPELMPERDLELFPAGNYNLGVAHGVPGVIGLLGLAQTAGVECRALLDGAVAWLLAQKLPPGSGSIFSYCVAAGVESRSTRVAWCYGDLGIAATLLVAGRAVGQRDWEREAVEIARQAAERTLEESGMQDGGICHGAAGIAHLFNRLHQATGDPALGAAARRWIDQTLALQQPGVGIGGFQMWVPNEDRELGWRDEAGFLTGSSGVGLALLAAATEVEPEWDRVLQISPV
ncbi:MAG TPA: lanthionine synthetase C family protein [Thermoanaerobaculia bacterium]|jgi:lantibiotic modifying enzyme|nr:lanthionine synthetase C family protein [Thermoanaerobaculia bacterium]